MCFVAFSATKSYGVEKADSLYKILKIKTTGSYYVIHAQRNDSLFKIISKKASLDENANVEQLSKGKRYCFDFGGKNNNPANIEAVPLSGSASYLHVKNSRFFTDGKTRIKFTKRFHYRLYMTKNLIGLYYSPGCPMDGKQDLKKFHL
jgi:hypothetical protein